MKACIDFPNVVAKHHIFGGCAPRGAVTPNSNSAPGIYWMIGTIFVKFSHLILIKIIKIVATRCQILRLKCTKFNFGWGSAPDLAWRAYNAPQTSSWI